ncbi:Uncharacterized protein TCM_012187 [Theobroma cacao]|uniref:Pentatricopeptide repeat-containing protein n=1 Tax=Theobroma cacao TaxID=3641 RepID=A0A061FUU6_THECC|nr:Uncharacterized protein TCM_012187 [Theobroma cacao]
MQGLALNGMAYQAFKMFDEMLMVGLKPDDLTFSALLTARCYAGPLDNGWEIFRRMKYEFSIQPRIEHGKASWDGWRVGRCIQFYLGLAKSSGLWHLGVLLSCFDGHGNSELAEVVSQQLLENEPKKVLIELCFHIYMLLMVGGMMCRS